MERKIKINIQAPRDKINHTRTHKIYLENPPVQREKLRDKSDQSTIIK
jgi:hypothetical protein